MSLERTKYLREFYRLVARNFNLDEIQVLTSYLSVDWEELAGDTKTLKINSLIAYLARRGRLAELLELAKEERPKAVWPDRLPSPEQQRKDAKANVTEAERKAIFDQFMNEAGPLATSTAVRKSTT